MKSMLENVRNTAVATVYGGLILAAMGLVCRGQALSAAETGQTPNQPQAKIHAGTPWNLRIKPTAGHKGGVLFLPGVQLHEGPGRTGAAGAAGHAHRLDPKTGIYEMSAIPLNDAYEPAARPPENPTETSSQHLSEKTMAAFARAASEGKWQEVIDLMNIEEEVLLWPVPRLALGHAMLATNRNNESLVLFASASGPVECAHGMTGRSGCGRAIRKAPPPTTCMATLSPGWERPPTPSRCSRWLLRSSIRTTIWQSMLGVQLYALTGKHNAAMLDLAKVIELAPEFVDGHASLGAIWVARSASEGAVDAYERR